MKRVIAQPFPEDPRICSAVDLGQAIRAARTQSGLRIQDAAPMLDMAVQTLVDIEAGKSGVSLGKVLSAARGFGLDLFALPRVRREAVRQRMAELAGGHRDGASGERDVERLACARGVIEQQAAKVMEAASSVLRIVRKEFV